MTIAEWLQWAFTDEKLKEFRELCVSGNLAYCSCCCLVGAPFADHADGKMRGSYRVEQSWQERADSTKHIIYARSLPGAREAEIEFLNLGETDVQRQERILPKIDAEIARRAAMRELCEVGELEEMTK